MTDTIIGNLNRTQLHLRWFRPTWGAWFAWRDWALHWKHMRGVNHRCYCPGSSCDGRIAIAGWGVVWFWSRYTGEVPCVCDRVMDEAAEAMFGGGG